MTVTEESEVRSGMATLLRRVVARLWGLLPLLALVGVIWLVAALFGSRSQQRIVTIMFIMMVVVVALYIFSGLSGILSFGHISFMGVGAYTTALLTIPTGFKATHLPNLPSPLSFLYDVELSFWMALLVAGCVTAIGGALIGVPLMRLDGLQAALATIAVLVIVNTVLREWETVTRGTTAMLGIPTDTTLGIATFGALVTIVVAWLFATSRWGLRLQASRDDPLAADSLGINTFKERMIAFTISAFFAGAGGVLWAHLLGTLAPTMFFWGITFSTVAMLIIGGIKSLAGAVIGAIAVSLLSEGLRRVEIGGLGPIPPPPTGLTQAGLALVLIVILLIRQRGITGGREVPMPSRLRQWALRG